jgi:hypothetical protein
VNRYSRIFVATCPNNGEQIIYTLIIETVGRMLQVEHIVTATALIKQGFHEQIADELHRRFGGRQVLRAHHHGVDIETIREAA